VSRNNPSANKSFPAFLLNGPILVQFDLNSVANAFKTGVAADFSNYTVSNAQLVYEVVQPDNDFISPTLPSARGSLSPTFAALVTQLLPSAPVIKSAIFPVGIIKKKAWAELETKSRASK
jgi:hypothetical protein